MDRKFNTISLELVNEVAVIRLNRPDKLNTLTIEMADELVAAIDLIDVADDVRAVVITGEGRAFCAGAALDDGGDIFRTEGDLDDVVPDAGGRFTLRLFDSLKPIVCAVNGAAVGIGATMQLAMDIRIASNDARFGFVFCRRGITPEAASSWFLPRIVGLPTALDWCLSGRVFGADEALQRGLVSAICKPEELLDMALAKARELTRHSAPVSVALTRQMLWKMAAADHPFEAHRVDSYMLRARSLSSDIKEGINAFFEKRDANFVDRVSDGLPSFYPWWKQHEFLPLKRGGGDNEHDSEHGLLR